jgi:hypothetical protein
VAGSGSPLEFEAANRTVAAECKAAVACDETLIVLRRAAEIETSDSGIIGIEVSGVVVLTAVGRFVLWGSSPVTVCAACRFVAHGVWCRRTSPHSACCSRRIASLRTPPSWRS